MILNPVIQGGTEEKVYKVTDEAGYMLNGTYHAGGIVTSKELASSIDPLVIKADDGTKIPYFTGGPNRASLLFVMPAQNIRIYFGSL